jgi:hypothetical protein
MGRKSSQDNVTQLDVAELVQCLIIDFSLAEV